MHGAANKARSASAKDQHKAAGGKRLGAAGGAPRGSPPNKKKKHKTDEAVAAKSGTSPRTASRARSVYAMDADLLKKYVTTGKISLSDASA
jgi:hypothetical protein